MTLNEINALANALVDSDDETIGAAFCLIARYYPAAFQSIQREIATAKAAQQYREQSRGV